MISALRRISLLYCVTGQRLDHWDPNVFLAALLVGIAALVGRQPADAAGAGRRTSTRSSSGCETSSDETGPHAGATQPLLLVNLLRPRRATAGRGWRVFREDLTGLAMAWVLVLVLVLATALFLRL